MRKATGIVDLHPQKDAIAADIAAGKLKRQQIIDKYQIDISETGLNQWWRTYKLGGKGSASIAEPEECFENETALLSELFAERKKAAAAEERAKMLDSQVKHLDSENEEIRELANLIRSADERKRRIPTWLTKKSNLSSHTATVNLVLSDLHLDEIVKPGSIRNVNAFNRRIALARLERTFAKAVELPRDYMAYPDYDGIVLHLAGDTFSGEIHEELALTNEGDGPYESLLYWLDPFVAGIKLLLDDYKKAHIVSVPGNHDRSTRKPINKGRVERSRHYLFCKLLEREFRGDKRVTWDIPLSPDALTDIHGTKILTTHGDRFRGGNGIGGILVPILRGDARTRQRQSAVGEPYDLLVMGHFHQYIVGPGVLINGSMKGYDEYAFNNSFSYEDPQQALFLVTQEHGPSFHMPIACKDEKKEKWDTV